MVMVTATKPTLRMRCTSCDNAYPANPLNTRLQPGTQFTAFCQIEKFETLHVVEAQPTGDAK